MLQAFLTQPARGTGNGSAGLHVGHKRNWRDWLVGTQLPRGVMLTMTASASAKGRMGH